VQKTSETEITAIATGGFGDYEFFFQGNSTGSQNVFTVTEEGTITVSVVDREGCTATVEFPFDLDVEIDIPDFFTPDSDGVNDEFSPNNREFFPNVEVIIYDRYGRVVAELDQVTNWDGNYKGIPLPTGDYWYIVNANDKEKKQYVGHFTLFR